jgi:hypothetical protein
MILNKDINLPYGFTASYWIITDIIADIANGKAIAKVVGYKDAQAFSDGKAKVGEWSVDFTMDPANESVGAVLGMVAQLVEDNLQSKVG